MEWNKCIEFIWYLDELWTWSKNPFAKCEKNGV